MGFKAPMEIADLLRDHDVSPMSINSHTDRCHRLGFTAQLLQGTEVGIEFQSMEPEGIPIDKFWEDHMTIPTDKIMEGVSRMIWETNEPMPPMSRKIWFWDLKIVDHEDGGFYRFDQQSRWAFLPQGRDATTLKCVELFSGGFAGWSKAWTQLTPDMTKNLQIVAIDNDIAACRSMAISQNMPMIPEDKPLPTDMTQLHGKSVVIQRDVMDADVRTLITKWEPEAITISAPCPAWSTAGWASGLNSIEGALLLNSLLQCKFWRPKVILLEQVIGFNSTNQLS